jgi:pantoate--beta-alanine ligase
VQIAQTAPQARALFDVLPRPLGFVPTMGALHDGHLALVARAAQDCVSVGASVFVNPLQFGANEDLAKYPRDFEGDRRKLADAGVAVLFAPSVEAMYPPGFSTSVDVGLMGTRFEGAVRPEHFRGVTTVVAKLLHIVRPDYLYLGQKDAQQTAVIRKMIRDLEFPVEVRIVPTLREGDGLAMSSRNVYLNSTERSEAPTLHRALETLRDALANGSTKRQAIELARKTLSTHAIPDYFDIVNAETFEPVDALVAPAFVVGAARFGGTRLIDNLWIEP